MDRLFLALTFTVSYLEVDFLHTECEASQTVIQITIWEGAYCLHPNGCPNFLLSWITEKRESIHPSKFEYLYKYLHGLIFEKREVLLSGQ
jgi:hypothetical protein